MPRSWRSIRVPQETYVNIILVKASLEEYNGEKVAIWQAIDVIMRELAKEIERTRKPGEKKIKIKVVRSGPDGE